MSSPLQSLAVSAPAKINLLLRVIGKRPDGFHELETVFQEIDLADCLTLTEQPEKIELTCDSGPLPTDNRNLAVRAALALQQMTGTRKGCSIDLRKRIPLSAGLGGGSSDAAAVLLGLNRLWNLDLKPMALLKVASELGSDVPFFLHGGTAYATGRGEQLRRLTATPPYFGVLIYPNLAISTKEVFAAGKFSLTNSENYFTFKFVSSSMKNPAQWTDRFGNDLERVVFERYPQLQELIVELRRAGAFYAHMSGSGSSVFGLFDSELAACSAKICFDPYDRWVFRPVYRQHRSLS